MAEECSSGLEVILGEELQSGNLLPIRVVGEIGRKAKHLGVHESCDLCYILF